MDNIRPKVKVWLASGEQGFFGPGALKLLILTDKLQSLKAACAQMELSYSKGWKIISNLESELGYPVLNRQQGGRHGGGCNLTDQGKAVMEKYEAFSKRSKELIETAYAEVFG
jgi:molybdate transport system regulatory protein